LREIAEIFSLLQTFLFNCLLPVNLYFSPLVLFKVRILIIGILLYDLIDKYIKPWVKEHCYSPYLKSSLTLNGLGGCGGGLLHPAAHEEAGEVSPPNTGTNTISYTVSRRRSDVI
jgi:hypothetical protein